jgi:signal peptidase II
MPSFRHPAAEPASANPVALRAIPDRATVGRLPVLALIALGVGADQLTKLAALVALGAPIEVTSFFTLRLGFNTGVSFGLFGESLASTPWFLGTAAAVAGVGFAAAGLASRRPADGVGFALIAAGALSNGIDRWRLGAVVDFLDLHWRGWSWPAFNVADAMIVVGAASLVLLSRRERRAGGPS